MESMQITSLGWFGHHNVGDEAFRYALRHLFPLGVEIKHIETLLPHLDTINRSDHLLIGGGNIVDRGFLKGLEKVQIPYSFVGVGLISGNDLSLLSGASNVIVRDRRSLSLATSVYPEAVLAPDLAFSLSPLRDVGKEFLEEESRKKFKRPIVGVFLNDCVSARFDSTLLKFVECEKVKLELARFLESLPYDVVFIPMSTTPPDDRRISLDVIGKMQRGYNYSCLTQEINPVKVLSMVSALDFAITMRLHASIFCTIAGVPFIDILHHDKSKGYLDEIGMPEVGIDFYELSIRVLAEKFSLLEENRESISQRLLDTAAQNKRNLEGLIHNVHLPRKRTD